MNDWSRTHTCGELTVDAAGSEVVLTGWVDVVRDLGGLTFVELRDREGTTQVLIGPDASDEVVSSAKRLNQEWVVSIKGKVLLRSEKTINKKLATGEIEVGASAIRILSEARTPPFPINDDTEVSEDLRLRYRYLDLRRTKMRLNLERRSKLARSIREYLYEQGFHEFETPYLTKSTPEGARDYLVPSRVHKGSFYALPQSPQLFKQLLMISGMERYFQIVRCFRDEDIRADRQPEFTQVDIEMSFVDCEDVFTLVEGLFADLLKVVGVQVATPFPRLTYSEAWNLYGSDKPDLRFGCEIADLSTVMLGSGYGIFDSALEGGGVVRAITASGCGRYSRKEIENLEFVARTLGGKGLAWACWSEKAFKSPLTRHIGDDLLKQAFNEAGGGEGDLLLIAAGEEKLVSTVLGGVRIELAKREGWIDQSLWKLAWITEFPLFEYSETDKRWYSMHHPFTLPHPEDWELIEDDPGSVRALAYDIVANGYELGGGSIRIHDAKLQQQVFRVLDISDEEAQNQFGFLLEALQYGTPPHGGIALGFDRIAMLASGGKSLREVIAFPKTTSAYDIMTGSPSTVGSGQLEELGVTLKKGDD